MTAESLPPDLAGAHAMILAERAARIAAEAGFAQARAEAVHAKADLTGTEALIAHPKLAIEKLRRALYGRRSERQARLLDQMELELEELEAAASEDESAAQAAAMQAARTIPLRRRPSRRPFPEHLPRERVVIAAPTACPCCGSARLSKLGEDVTETLEVIPRRWTVVQTVRERFSCRDCERITQPPAPFHVTPRGFAGPQLLATILFEKFAQHRPLNRQSERFAQEGIRLSVSTLADQVGACTKALWPLHRLIEAHVLAAERLHGDDTTVPILAKGRFFELADMAGNARRGRTAAVISPIALEAVGRIDALFAIERGVNGLSAAERLEARTRESAPLVADLEAWLRDQRSRLSRSSAVAEPIDYMLRRWPAFARFLDDGRVCLSNNAAERALRGFALGRKAWLFAGSERGAERAALVATLVMTATLNDVDPQAWLADVLARIADHPVQHLDALLPWNWRRDTVRLAA